MSHASELFRQVLSGIKDRKFVLGAALGLTVSALPSLKCANDAQKEAALARMESSLCRDNLNDAQKENNELSSTCSSDKALIILSSQEKLSRVSQELGSTRAELVMCKILLGTSSSESNSSSPSEEEPSELLENKIPTFKPKELNL